MQTGTRRVEIFSDGVMAIIITIMVLELKLPDFNENQGEYDIKHHLIELLPHFGAYVFSFIMIGILWTNHHQLFHLLGKTDNLFLGLNLVFLFWISLIPFVTGIMGASPLIPISTSLYGVIMLMTSLTLSFMRSYTLNKNLVHTDEERDVDKKIEMVLIKDRIQSYIGSAFYFISVFVAFVSVYLSYFCFIIPIILFLWPSKLGEKKVENKVIEKNK